MATKAQREKAERLLLKNMLDTQPKLKQIIDGLIDNPNPELIDILKANIEPHLKAEFMKGVQTGWISCLLGMAVKVEKCKDIDEAVKILKDEADKKRKEMGLKPIDEELEEIENEVSEETGSN